MPLPGATHDRDQVGVRPRAALDLFRNASSQKLMVAGACVALAWIPPALLSAFGPSDKFLSFLTDYASLSRFFIIIPVLILAEAPLRGRLSADVHHFEEFLVPNDQQANFRESWESCKNLQDSKLVRVVILLLAYATVLWLKQYLNLGGSEFMLWWR